MGSPLVRWLAGRSPDELATVLSRRPDTLVGPPLSDLGTLAGRLQMNGSVLTAFATVPLPGLQVVDAMAHCGGPAVGIHRLATVLGRAVDDPDLTATLAALAERALVWTDGDGLLRMAGALWTACAGPEHDGTRASFDPRPPSLSAVDAPADVVSREATAAGTLAVERVGALLEAAPVALLKSGGVGTRELRRLGPDARLWLELAFGAGLLGYADGALTPTPAHDDWRAASPGGRLVPLLRAWRTLPVAGTASYRPDGEPAGAALTADPSWSSVVDVRAALVELLASRPADEGATDESVAELLRWRLPVLVPETSLVDDLLAEARLVGAVAHGALTPLGRAVFDPDPGVLTAVAERQLPSAVTEAVFQNDLTALVPGVPTGALADLLDAAAARESRTGAATWRFSAASVRAALDAGYTPSSLRDALRSAAAGGTLPQALEYLVADVGRQHGLVRVRPVACVVHAGDPVLLKELVRHRALRGLRLQVLAPTVLASGQPLAATLDALRAAGYAPVGEDVTGAPTLVRRPVARGVPRRRAGHVPAARTAPELTDVSALARRLLAHGSARAARLEVAPDPADDPADPGEAAGRGPGAGATAGPGTAAGQGRGTAAGPGATTGPRTAAGRGGGTAAGPDATAERGGKGGRGPGAGAAAGGGNGAAGHGREAAPDQEPAAGHGRGAGTTAGRDDGAGATDGRGPGAAPEQAAGSGGADAGGRRGSRDGGRLRDASAPADDSAPTPSAGDPPRRLEVATTRPAGTPLEPSETTRPPLLWLVPDPPPAAPADPDQVAALVRRHARTLSGPEQDLLTRAIAGGEPVRIDYRDTGGDFSTRVVEPLELDHARLTAWCQLRDAERVFTLDRIESVSPA